MALNAAQRAKLTAEARRRGIDPAKLIAAAEAQLEKQSTSSSSPESAQASEMPKLFQYHLPFVTVGEVRRRWLGLDESFAGDDEVASDWAAKHGGGTGGDPAAS
jgi:hypothetical protein